MTYNKSGWFQSLAMAASVLPLLFLTSCLQFGKICGFGCDAEGGCGDSAKVCGKPTIRALAQDLDELENHIEKYGSVVAKQPDVWGQARLTKYRQEFETVMAVEKDNFNDSLQGSLSRSDQAYFADAFALSAAVSGNTAIASPPTAVATASSSSPAPGTTLQPPPLVDQPDVFASVSGTNVGRNSVTTGPQLGFATAGKAGIQLEPILRLDQKAAFLNHLQELRRINEGDDTADSPGYSLNLVRIPVSVLPGKCTDIGHGAEITMTLTPYLSDELLPTTFRNLLLNDIVDQVGFPVTQFINNPENSCYLAQSASADLDELLTYVDSHRIVEMAAEPQNLARLRWKNSLQPLFARPEWAWIDELLRAIKDDPSLVQHAKPVALSMNSLRPLTERDKAKLTGESQTDRALVEKMSRNPEVLKTANESLLKSDRFQAVVKSFEERIRAMQAPFPVPATKSRRARMPFPPAQTLEVYGDDFAFHLVLGAYHALAQERFLHPCPDSSAIYIHLPDVQAYLQEELSATQKFLADPTNADLWQFCTPALVTAIRGHQLEQLRTMRESFRLCLVNKSDTAKTESERGGHSMTAALAWAAIVESALLTDQLAQDMKEAAAAKNCPCAPAGWLDYFSPNPSPEARRAFNDYVRCRWPIHVFAIDPAAQQQNIADAFSGRREMQLAMSLAFVSGQVSARNMMRYARRIEYDFNTIDVNGTAIGFSHGDETFGWRFYPRFQTPDIEGNATVLVRDLLIGGPNRNAFLRQRRLEPGMRECVAVVMMPSFVPYADLNVSSDWFALTNPKRKLMDSTYAMRLSKAVKGIQNCGGNVADADCYRDGDLARLLVKARQLEDRLPLQSAKVQVPYENTLGGFAMFNTGVTDLAPELTGWYGAPSVNLKSPTTVFLVGNHFSVHQTRLVAGGLELTNLELLSRQVLKAVIPAGASTVGDSTQQFVDVHLATPYGTTPHLLIPVCTGSAVVDAKPFTFTVAFVYGGLGIIAPPADAGVAAYKPPTIAIPKPADVPDAATLDAVVTLGTAKVTYTGIANTGGVYQLPGGPLTSAIFSAYGTTFGPEATNPPTPQQVKLTVTFKNGNTPVPGDHPVPPLTINWIKAPKCCGN